MEEPYHIQRAKFQVDSRPDAIGIDKLLRLDYMGSAEFEFGALPVSLKRVRANLNDYIMFQYSFKKFPSKSVTVYCKKEQYDFVGDILEQLAENKIRLKERCDLNDWLNPREHSYNRNDFWWDIDQDWFFWKFKNGSEFDEQFKQALLLMPTTNTNSKK